MESDSKLIKIKEMESYFFPSNPKLNQCCVFFYEAGYEDIHFILSLSDEEWESMLDAVTDECKKVRFEFKAGHRMQFRRRLKELQLNKNNNILESQQEIEMAEKVPLATKIDIPPQLSAKPSSKPITVDKKRSQSEIGQSQDNSTANFLLFRESLRCFRLNWLFCIGLSICSLIVGLLLMLLYTLAPTNSTDPTQVGGWLFLRVCMIIAFVWTGIAFCGVCITYGRSKKVDQWQCPTLEQYGIKCPTINCERCGFCCPGGVCPNWFPQEYCTQLCSCSFCTCPDINCPEFPDCSQCENYILNMNCDCCTNCTICNTCYNCECCEVKNCPDITDFSNCDCDCDCDTYCASCSQCCEDMGCPTSRDIFMCMKKCFKIFICKCKFNIHFDD